MKPTSVKLTGKIGLGLCVFGLMICLCLLSACSSRGAAPVYNRGESPASPSKVKRPGSYQVKSGDTLYSIAWRYRVNYHSLAIWNRIKGPNYRIYSGQWLRLHPPSLTQQYGGKNKKIARSPTKVRKSPPAVVIKKSQPAVSPSKTTTSKKDATGKLKLIWRWPTKGRVVQTYSSIDPARKGVRISGVSGQSIVAAESGKVVYSGSGLVGYGNLIIIKHNKNYLSAYGYNKNLLVKEGDKVLKNERIAQMGSPRNGMDPVLHFEIRKQGKPIDPLSLLPRK